MELEAVENSWEYFLMTQCVMKAHSELTGKIWAAQLLWYNYVAAIDNDDQHKIG